MTSDENEVMPPTNSNLIRTIQKKSDPSLGQIGGDL
jgi:hypothetical protein